MLKTAPCWNHQPLRGNDPSVTLHSLFVSCRRAGQSFASPPRRSNPPRGSDGVVNLTVTSRKTTVCFASELKNCFLLRHTGSFLFCFVFCWINHVFQICFFSPPMLWFAVQMLHFVQRKQLWGARGSSPGILRDFFSLFLSLSLFLFLFCITSLTLHIELTPLDRFGVVKEYVS